MNLPALLPKDVLADVLGRLAPRWLAACRSVCTAWRAAVDERGLLQRADLDLLPLKLAGILINFGDSITDFFSRPSTNPSISGKHNDYLPEASRERSWSYVVDHCNGLFLLDKFLLNPATRWHAALPPCPPPREEMRCCENQYLAYDPTVSPHYQVFSIPEFWWSGSHWSPDPDIEKSEWPPSVYILNVYSSVTGQWKKRSFVREGKAAGTIGDMRLDSERCSQRRAVYRRGSLYVHCQTNFVMRLSLSDDKYRIVERPVDTKVSTFIYLGKSAFKVYAACFYERFRLRVWFLGETCGQMEWVLNHEGDLYEWLLKHQLLNQLPKWWYHFELRPRGPWTLQDLDHYHNPLHEEDSVETPTEDEVEWNSDASDDEELERRSNNDHSVLGTYYNESIKILGFHPFKEIIFLQESKRRGLAYHWRISKFEDLGNLHPTKWCWVDINNWNIEPSFPYTPCWI